MNNIEIGSKSSVSSLPGEVLEKLVNLIDIRSLQKLCLASRSIHSKLAAPSLHLELRGIGEYHKPMKWPAGHIIRELKGIRSFSAFSEKTGPCVVEKEVILSLPSSLTHFSLSGPGSSLLWAHKPDVSIPGSEPINMASMFPHLTSLVIQECESRMSNKLMSNVLRNCPPLLTRLELSSQEWARTSEFLRHLHALPTTLTSLTLPLVSSSVLDWIPRLSSLESLQLPQLTQWLVNGTKTVVLSSLKQLNVRCLDFPMRKDNTFSAWQKLEPHVFFSEVFPNLTELDFHSMQLHCLMPFPNLVKVTLRGEWRDNWVSPPLALFPRFITDLNLHFLQIAKQPLNDARNWLAILPAGLRTFHLPNTLTPHFLHPELLPRSLTCLVYPNNHLWDITIDDRFPNALRELRCADLHTPDDIYMSPLPSTLHTHFAKAPSLEYVSVRQTHITVLAKIDMFRFPKATPPYFGSGEIKNGWIGFADACFLGRIDLLHKMVIRSASPRSFRIQDPEYSPAMAHFLKSTPPHVMNWLRDRQLIIDRQDRAASSTHPPSPPKYGC
jgi:hypothetical protein